nr:hypothetical protein [uncultured Rhodopila sp.]
MITAVLATVAAAPAFAQTETYETPTYTPQQPTALDPNFGLPSFGMPGSELPQQRTQAPEPVAPDKPEIFQTVPPDFSSQTKRLLKPGFTTGYATMDTTPPTTSETPLFTTNETGTTGGDSTTGDDGN